MQIADQLKEEIPFLDVKLFDLGATPITIGTVTVMVIVMLATGLVSWAVTRAIQNAFKLRQAIWWGLKEAGITIAFPQLDLHLDKPVVQSIEGLRATA